MSMLRKVNIELVTQIVVVVDDRSCYF